MDIRQYHQLMQRQNLLRGEPVNFFLGGDFDLSALADINQGIYSAPIPTLPTTPAPAPDPAPAPAPTPTVAPPTYNPPPVTVAPSPAPVAPPPVYTQPAPIAPPAQDPVPPPAAPILTQDPVIEAPAQSFSNAKKVDGGYEFSIPNADNPYAGASTTQFISDSEVGNVTSSERPLGFGMYETDYNITVPSTVPTTQPDTQPTSSQPEVVAPIPDNLTPDVPFNPFEVETPIEEPLIDRDPIDTFNLDRSTEDLIGDEGTFFDDQGQLRRTKNMYEIQGDRQGLPPIGTGNYATEDVFVRDREGNIINDPNFQRPPRPVIEEVGFDPFLSQNVTADAGEPQGSPPAPDGPPDSSAEAPLTQDRVISSERALSVPEDQFITETRNRVNVDTDKSLGTEFQQQEQERADALLPPDTTTILDEPPDVFNNTLTEDQDIIERLNTNSQTNQAQAGPITSDVPTQSFANAERTAGGYFVNVPTSDNMYSGSTQRYFVPNEAVVGDVTSRTTPLGYGINQTDYNIQLPEDYNFTQKFEPGSIGAGTITTPDRVVDIETGESFQPDIFQSDAPSGTQPETETQGPDTVIPEVIQQEDSSNQGGSRQGGTREDPGDLTMEQILQNYLTPSDNFDDSINSLYMQTFGRFPTQEEYNAHKGRFGDKLDSIERKALFDEMLADSGNTGPVGFYRSILEREPESPEAIAAAQGLNRNQFFQRAIPELLARNLGGIKDYANVMGVNPTFSQYSALDPSLRGDPRLLRQQMVEQGSFQNAARDAFRGDLGYDPSAAQMQRLVDSGTFLNPREFRRNLAVDLVRNRPRFGSFNPDYLGGLTGSYNPYAAPFYNRFAPQPTFYRPPSYTMGYQSDPYRSSFNPFANYQMTRQPEVYRPRGLGFKG